MSVKKALDKFGKSVIKQSRTQLSKKDINASKDLYDSLDYSLKVSKNSFELIFSMEDYAAFINDGVVGSKEDRTKNLKTKLGSKKFRYTNKMPPAKVFDKWSVRRGIAPRNEQGQFISRKSINFAIARGVFLKGIKTSEFFTRPFEVAFKQLPEDLLKAYGLQIDTLLKNSL